MKITVKQLKQLIREQVEEMAARRGRGVEAEEPDLSSPDVEEEWADWVRKNEMELKQVLRTKYNVEKMDLATALKKGKKAFFEKASYDPDFMGRAVKIRGLFPEFEEYYINRRKRLGY